MSRHIVTCILLIFSHICGFSQHEDTLLVADNTPFLKDLMMRKGDIYPFSGLNQGILQTKYKHSQIRGQYVIKIQDDLYVFIDWTGILYKAIQFTDSQITFKRIDTTINLNYNGGGKLYVHDKEIHVFGGYSFWKTNGTDKKFNKKDMQWDVIPLSEEIIPQILPTPLVWHDLHNKYLWLPYQRVLNAGVKDLEYMGGKIKPFVYRLNLQTKDWEIVGPTHPDAVDIIRKSGIYLPTEKGILLAGDGFLFNIDFINNKITRFRDYSVYQSFLRITHTGFRYLYHDTLFYYNADRNKYDSLWIDPKNFEDIHVPVYDNSGTTGRYLLTGAIVFIVVSALVVSVHKYTSRKKLRDSEVVISSNNEQKPIETFTDMEVRLISLLKEKSLMKQTVTPTEINYVLGLKDKNIGLQKKVRSDVMNSINDKYMEMSGSQDPLIKSVRNESDKRHIEYFIDPKRSPI